ncbi:MAG: hypothetical protein ACLTTQ_05015 [Christensenellales bacterium]
MNEYSIHVTDGKVIGDSALYLTANDLLGRESKRLCDLTDALDKSTPEKKNNKIAEYKCAKYRYAAVSLIHSIVYNINHFRKTNNLEYSHYLLQPFDDIFREYPEYLTLYEAAADDEKPDLSLYYSVSRSPARDCRAKSKNTNATDWKIELMNASADRNSLRAAPTKRGKRKEAIK